jgi:hypothetical protein
MSRRQSVFLAAALLTSACGDDSEPHSSVLTPVVVPLIDAGPALPIDTGVPAFVPPSDAGQRIDATLPGAVVDASTLLPLADASSMVMPGLEAGMATPDGGVGAVPGNPCTNGSEPLAAGVRVRELSLYQTVKIPLYKDTTWVTTRNASVVQGKKSLVRVFVEPMTGFAPHTLRALLTLDNNGTKTVLSAERNIMRASTDEAADSTFDFQVMGELISGTTQLSAAVIEATCTAPAAGATGARIPATGTQALNATAIGKLTVVLVPVTLAGRTPDTSEAQLTKVKDALRAYYPVADVQVTARAPITYAGTVRADGGGWSEVLNQIGRTRQTDAVSGNVYYFGLMSPAAGFKDYCKTGCVLGLAPQTTFVSRANQIGLGVGFVDENTYTTVVHELGHAHGLPHAPCVPRGGSIEGADTKFPYPGAKIGSWGWDSRNNKLMSPVTYLDIMSYCDPVWISDYNYEKIATRCKAVNTAARIFFNTDEAPVTWSGILLSAAGSSRWLGMVLDESPGETSAAKALDAQGHVVAEVRVVRIPLSHSDDSFLYVPDLDPLWASLDLGDRVLKLSAIAPAAP